MNEGNGTLQISESSRNILIAALVSETLISLEEITNLQSLLTPDGLLRVYPIPAKEFLLIEPADLGNKEGSIRIEMYSLPGIKMMDTGMKYFSRQGIELNIRSLDPGNYILIIHFGEKHYRSLISII